MRSAVLIECEVALPVPAKPAWSLLMDVSAWPQWQKAYVLDGVFEPGANISHGVNTTSRSGKLTPIVLDGAVLEVRPCQMLRWRLGMAAIVGVEVSIELEDQGRTSRMKHALLVRGLIPTLFAGRTRKILTPFAQAFCLSIERRLGKVPNAAKRPVRGPHSSRHSRSGR